MTKVLCLNPHELWKKWPVTFATSGIDLFPITPSPPPPPIKLWHVKLRKKVTVKRVSN